MAAACLPHLLWLLLIFSAKSNYIEGYFTCNLKCAFQAQADAF